MYQTIILYTLNLLNVVSQLHLNKTGEKISIIRKKREPQQSIVKLLETQDKKQFYKLPEEKNTLYTRGK